MPELRHGENQRRERHIKKYMPRLKAAKKSYEKLLLSGAFKVSNRKYSKSERGKEVNKIYNMQYHFRRKYGISIADRDAMLLAQNYRCASCEAVLDKNKTRGTHIDHCHKTNVIRGILCADCNVSLGRMKESPDRIRKLADYAERHCK